MQELSGGSDSAVQRAVESRPEQAEQTESVERDAGKPDGFRPDSDYYRHLDERPIQGDPSSPALTSRGIDAPTTSDHVDRTSLGTEPDQSSTALASDTAASTTAVDDGRTPGMESDAGSTDAAPWNRADDAAALRSDPAGVDSPASSREPAPDNGEQPEAAEQVEDGPDGSREPDRGAPTDQPGETDSTPEAADPDRADEQRQPPWASDYYRHLDERPIQGDPPPREASTSHDTDPPTSNEDDPGSGNEGPEDQPGEARIDLAEAADTAGSTHDLGGENAAIQDTDTTALGDAGNAQEMTSDELSGQTERGSELRVDLPDGNVMHVPRNEQGRPDWDNVRFEDGAWLEEDARRRRAENDEMVQPSNDRSSRGDGFRQTAYENADDALDVTKKSVDHVQDLLEDPPPESTAGGEHVQYTCTTYVPPTLASQQADNMSMGDAITGIMVFGAMTFEGIKSAYDRRKGKTDGSNG